MYPPKKKCSVMSVRFTYLYYSLILVFLSSYSLMKAVHLKFSLWLHQVLCLPMIHCLLKKKDFSLSDEYTQIRIHIYISAHTCTIVTPVKVITMTFVSFHSLLLGALSDWIGCFCCCCCCSLLCSLCGRPFSIYLLPVYFSGWSEFLVCAVSVGLIFVAFSQSVS